MTNTRNNLKGYFQAGKIPTQSNFSESIDSFVHLEEDKASSIGTVDIEDDKKFVTPKVAKMLVDKYAVQKVNGSGPDGSGNVTITNITGTAATITGTVSKSQVDGLQGDLDAKINTSQLRTINGNSLIGTTDLVISAQAASSVQSAFLTLVQTVTGAGQSILTDHVFIIPPGKSAAITGILCFTSNSTTSGAAFGIKVQQQNGGTGNAVGGWSIEVATTAATSNASVRDGNSFVILPNNTGGGEVTSTVSTTPSTGNISATLSAVIKNTSLTLVTTISITIRPSVSTAILSAQPGTGTVVVIS